MSFVEDTSPSKLKYPKGAFFILAGYLLERFVYYGLTGGIVFYMQKVLQYSASTSSSLKAMIEGLIYLAPIVGAILADTYFGKFRTVFTLCCCYCIGTMIFSSSAITPLMGSVQGIRGAGIAGYLVLGLSAGLMKAAYSSLGPDQFQLPEQRTQQERFFYAFYWMINAGAFLGQILTGHLRSTVQCFGDNYCYILPYVILCALMILSTVIFLSGKRFYTEAPPDTMVIRCIKCIACGIRRAFSSDRKPVEHWLDRTRNSFDQTLIDDVKKILRVFLIFITFPFFWALFFQTSTGMIFQAKRLDDMVGSYRIPPEITSSVNPLLILGLIPLFEFVIYPFLRKRNMFTKTTSRMLVGMCLASFSFIIYGLINLDVEQNILAKNEAQLNVFNSMKCEASLSNDLPTIPNDLSVLRNIKVPTNEVIKLDSLKIDADIVKVAFIAKCGSYQEIINVVLEKEKETSVIFFDSKARVLSSTKDYLKDTDADAKLKVVGREGFASDNIKIVYGEFKQNISISNGSSPFLKISPHEYTVFVGNKTVGKSLIRQDGVYLAVLGDDFVRTFPVTKPSSTHMGWLFPQYLIITTGEVLFSVSSLDFAYSEAPKSMKSVIQSTNLLTITIGLWFLALFTKISSSSGVFDYRASNEAFTYAVGMAINACVFYFLAKYYHRMKNAQNQAQNAVSKDNYAFEQDNS